MIDAIGNWKAFELEEAAAEQGVVMPVVRSLPEMLTERQFTDILSDMPLIEVTRIGDSVREPLPPIGDQPFSGLRALGMGHVIAGAGLGRPLALHGANVLNLWRGGGEKASRFMPRPMSACARRGCIREPIVPC